MNSSVVKSFVGVRRAKLLPSFVFCLSWMEKFRSPRCIAERQVLGAKMDDVHKEESVSPVDPPPGERRTEEFIFLVLSIKHPSFLVINIFNGPISTMPKY